MSSANFFQRHGTILKATIPTLDLAFIQHLEQHGQWWSQRERDHLFTSTIKVRSTWNFYLQTLHVLSKATRRWGINGQNNEVVDKYNYLGVMMESIGG